MPGINSLAYYENSYITDKFFITLAPAGRKGLLGTNTLAYFPFSSVTKKRKCLWHLAPDIISLTSSLDESVWNQNGEKIYSVPITRSKRNESRWEGKQLNQGKLTEWKGRFSTVDLLIRVACFVKKDNIFNIKMS